MLDVLDLERPIAAPAREFFDADPGEALTRGPLLIRAMIAAAFRTGGMVNYQIQLSRSRFTLPLTRDYMVKGERALRG